MIANSPAAVAAAFSSSSRPVSPGDSRRASTTSFTRLPPPALKGPSQDPAGVPGPGVSETGGTVSMVGPRTSGKLIDIDPKLSLRIDGCQSEDADGSGARYNHPSAHRRGAVRAAAHRGPAIRKRLSGPRGRAGR